MRHRKSGRKLGMDSSARKAMYRNMVTSLMVHGQIRTTEARAKELRRYADRVISMGKRAPLLDGLDGDALRDARADRVTAIRRVRKWIHDDEALERVFGDYADRFRTRPGGYTRIIKAGRRPGDSAPMAIIQLVEAYDPIEADALADPIEDGSVEEAPVEDAPIEDAAEAGEADADTDDAEGDTEE